jgi:hypothetical protein
VRYLLYCSMQRLKQVDCWVSVIDHDSNIHVSNIEYPRGLSEIGCGSRYS